jgi:hypothetical protein
MQCQYLPTSLHAVTSHKNNIIVYLSVVSSTLSQPTEDGCLLGCRNMVLTDVSEELTAFIINPLFINNGLHI